MGRGELIESINQPTYSSFLFAPVSRGAYHQRTGARQLGVWLEKR